MSTTPLAIGSAALLVALFGGGNTVAAQATVETAELAELQGVTVVAPRLVRKRAGIGRRVWVAEQRAEVSHADLDLTQPADLDTLHARISEAARWICAELSSLYPDGRPSTEDCTRRAIDDAMAAVREEAREQEILAAAGER